MGRDMHNVTSIGHCFWRTNDSSARKAAVKYAANAGNYLMDAAGYSLLTEIYYLSHVLLTYNMRATFDTLAQEWGSREPPETTTTSS